MRDPGASARACANAADTSIEIDFRGGLAIGTRHLMAAIVVVLDVVSGNLQISNLAALNSDTTESAVTDVRTADDRLMQIDGLKVDADAAMVNVAADDDHVAVIGREMNAMPQVSQ